jgi:hypothetical protein
MPAPSAVPAGTYADAGGGGASLDWTGSGRPEPDVVALLIGIYGSKEL